MNIMLNRREFLKFAGGGVAGGMAALVVGNKLSWVLENQAFAATVVQTLDFRITDAMKEMVTHNALNDARCYFWIYKSVTPDLQAEVPGPVIFATRGDTIRITLTNDLDEPHAFFIPGVFDSGPIAPGQTVTRSFRANNSGSFLYYDNLNSPVNRVMGLHGAFIVLPGIRRAPNKFTPYDLPTPAVQALFNDLGDAVHWPGLSWEEADVDPASLAPAFRQYIWLLHQASPNLFREVGSLPAGELYPAATFVNAFLRDPFSPTNANRTPQYFTINGQSGSLIHANPHITPNLRVGEPTLIRVLNAGLWTHSMHLHANHIYVIAVNGVVQANPIWIDVFNSNPLDTWDWLNPYMRPPDVPNARGIGMPDTPLMSLSNPLIPGSAPHPVWPPIEEINMLIPEGATAGGVPGGVPIDVQLSPLCYPEHDHSEPTQTSQGGNYNLGLIAGMNVTGDRNIDPAGVTTFPNAPNMWAANVTRLAAPQMPEHL